MAAYSWGGRALMVCAVLAMPLGWRKRKSLRRVWVLGMMLVSLVCGVSSCAGAGGSGGQLHLGGGTPPGSYPVTVTASANGVKKTVAVTLVVN